MKLYNRDFNQLKDSELRDWDSIKKKEIVNSKNTAFRTSCYHLYPEAVRHHLSLFPNNHLDPLILRKKDQLRLQVQKFIELLNNESNGEREILNHIKVNEAYFIVGSILSNYSFGHHNTYIFPEFMLGTSYRVDYLAVGRSSGGHKFVFIEFENSRGRITRKDGNFGDVIKKGLSQVCDWDEWIDSNFQSLSELFNCAKGDGKNLPNEFYKLDKSRIHYTVVAGRRSDYNEKTYRLRRKEREQRKINLLHYDNLIDLSDNVIGKRTF